MRAGADPGRFLRWYPKAWRERYGDEFLVFVEDSFGPDDPPLSARLSIVRGGITERARRSGLIGASVSPAERVRAGIVVVLISWTAMVIAGSSFAKLSENFDAALPHASTAHRLPDLTYGFIQTAAGGVGLIVIAAVILALPALVRFLRSGGWPSMRAHALRGAGSTVLTAALTAPLLVWAHHLSAHQRNGGSAGYSALFLVWAASVVVTLILVTVLGVVATRKVDLARPLLAAEAGVAVAAALAMVGMVAATGLWWALVAQRGSTFAPGNVTTPLGARLVGTVTVMALAAAAASAGAVRVVRSLPDWSRT